MMSNADSNSSNSGNSVLLVGSDSNDEFVPGRGSGVVPERGPDVVPEKDSSAVPEKGSSDFL
jgi:hypothetical protein